MDTTVEGAPKGYLLFDSFPGSKELCPRSAGGRGVRLRLRQDVPGGGRNYDRGPEP